MQKLKVIFPLIGVLFIGLWFVKTITYVKTGSFESLTHALNKNQILVLLGFACFWAYPTINWINSDSKINYSKMIKTLKEEVYPTYGRQIPGWAHGLRVVGFGGFLYFMIGSADVLNDELVFNWNYIFPAAISAALFFSLPFVFQRKP